jgi:hypothetical protein
MCAQASPKGEGGRVRSTRPGGGNFYELSGDFTPPGSLRSPPSALRGEGLVHQKSEAIPFTSQSP